MKIEKHASILNHRSIDERYMPNVKGIDLEQALNYIELKDVSEDFIYDKYTGTRLPYIAGNRPVLELLCRNITKGIDDEIDIIKSIASYIAKEIKWAGFYHKQFHKKLAGNRAFSEEKLIESQYAWCNEQARIFCCMSQIIGLPSRIVFACDLSATVGHVVVEVFTKQGWLMVDQTFGFLFIKDNQVVRAVDVFCIQANKDYFAPVYKQLCHELIDELGLDIVKDEFLMATLHEPINGFERLGFHNYFIL